ncbi:MAG: alpha,alpha-trehalase TreA [Elusimicrobiales bacterium]|nr:alpha,alpha-trehalase TreA [Elusimicrobiales bacterium]
MNTLKRAASALAFAVIFSFSAQAGNPPAPDAVYGKLFNDVQLSGIFGDSKAFPDCVPVKSPALIVKDYEKARKTPGFSLGNFVADNFTFPVGPAAGAVAVSTGADAREHVISLWPLLERPKDTHHEGSSLLALPYPYIVPGGRFREIYYWDSYFTMLGLLQSGKIDTMESTVKNFAYLINTYGHIPNGNRSYYLSRSQPPYFTLMVKLLQKAKGENSGVVAEYLPAIEKEYEFWMADSGKLKKTGDATRRTVKYGSAILNRYWDDNPVPRQESYKEDIETAKSSARRAPEVYRDIRAAAESGMDFSSRWFADGKNLASIETVAIIPVDLNCLLYDVEMTLADAYKTGGKKKAGVYAERAARRKDAVNKLMYDPAARFYTDFDFKKSARTGRLTLAGMYPFFLNAAPQDRIAGAAKTLADSFLKDGGVVTTLAQTGQQWDSPNGWPPLQWITVTGLLNYGQKDLALDIARRWTSLNEKVYKRTGKMMEKYNVVDTSLEAGGGEYPGQDGFGWTNGVYLALKALAEKN